MSTVADQLKTIAANIKAKLDAINVALNSKDQSDASDLDDVATKIDAIEQTGVDVSGVTATAADVRKTDDDGDTVYFVTSAGVRTAGTITTVSHPTPSTPTITSSGSAYTLKSTHTQSAGYTSGGTASSLLDLGTSSVDSGSGSINTSSYSDRAVVTIPFTATEGYSDGTQWARAYYYISKVSLPSPSISLNTSTGTISASLTSSTAGYMTADETESTKSIGIFAVNSSTMSLSSGVVTAKVTNTSGYNASAVEKVSELDLANMLTTRSSVEGAASATQSTVYYNESYYDSTLVSRYTISKPSGTIPIALYLSAADNDYYNSTGPGADNKLVGLYIDFVNGVAVALEGSYSNTYGNVLSGFNITALDGDRGISVSGTSSSSTTIGVYIDETEEYGWVSPLYWHYTFIFR